MAIAKRRASRAGIYWRGL